MLNIIEKLATQSWTILQRWKKYIEQTWRCSDCAVVARLYLQVFRVLTYTLPALTAIS